MSDHPLSTTDLLRRDGCLRCVRCGLHVVPFRFKGLGRCPDCGCTQFENADRRVLHRVRPVSEGKFKEAVGG